MSAILKLAEQLEAEGTRILIFPTSSFLHHRYFLLQKKKNTCLLAMKFRCMWLCDDHVSSHNFTCSTEGRVSKVISDSSESELIGTIFIVTTQF